MSPYRSSGLGKFGYAFTPSPSILWTYQTRRGDYADYVPLPVIIGHDISGVVEAKGVE